MRFFSTLTACAASLLAMTSTTFANPVAQSSSIGGAANTPFSGQPIGSGLPSTYGLSNSATPNASPAKLVKRGNIGYNNGGTILTGNRNVYGEYVCVSIGYVM